jgi:hypothetical protein
MWKFPEMGVAPNHPSFQSCCHSFFMDFPFFQASMFGVSPFMETPMYIYIGHPTGLPGYLAWKIYALYGLK